MQICACVINDNYFGRLATIRLAGRSRLSGPWCWGGRRTHIRCRIGYRYQYTLYGGQCLLGAGSPLGWCGTSPRRLRPRAGRSADSESPAARPKPGSACRDKARLAVEEFGEGVVGFRLPEEGGGEVGATDADELSGRWSVSRFRRSLPESWSTISGRGLGWLREVARSAISCSSARAEVD